MKSTTFFFIVFLAFSCQNNTKTKNTDESNNSDAKCIELLKKTTLLQSELDKADSEILNLQCRTGKYEYDECTGGPSCQTHILIYLKRDSLSKLIMAVEAAYQKEIKNSSIDFRLKYYSDLSKKIKIQLDTAKVHALYLESGANGYSKCSNGENCAVLSHREIYKTRERKQKELDSIELIIDKL